MRRFIAVLLLTVDLLVFLTSCKDAIEVDELVYAASIGIDRGVSDYWRLSVKYPLMRHPGEQEQTGSGSKGEGNEYEVVTMDAPSFYTGVDMIDSNISRHLNFQHIKFIVISEEVARSGQLIRYLAPIVRFREIRRTAFMLICKGPAKEFMEKNKPPLGSSLTKDMSDWVTQMEHTGFYTNTTLKDFYNKLKSPYQQPVAILAGVNPGKNFIENGPKAKMSSNLKPKYEAGQLPIMGGSETELFGCALFDGDRMTESLDGYETRLMLLATGDFVSGSFTIPDPKKEEMLVSLRLESERRPDVKVDLKGEHPKIYIRLKLQGDLVGMQSGVNYEKEDLKSLLEQSATAQLKGDLDALFNKCRAIREDIFGFGGVAARQFATVEEWEAYGWFRRFENAEIHTEVDLALRRSGTFIKTSPVITTKGAK